jgi:hypothetical protein
VAILPGTYLDPFSILALRCEERKSDAAVQGVIFEVDRKRIPLFSIGIPAKVSPHDGRGSTLKQTRPHVLTLTRAITRN